MKKPELEVMRFEDRDVIATSGYRPNGYLMTEFAKTNPSQLFSAMRDEYNEMRANSAERPMTAVWAFGTAEDFLIPSISKRTSTQGYNNRDNWIYIWWDDTDKSWRTDGYLLSHYSTDANAYDPNYNASLWDKTWPTN